MDRQTDVTKLILAFCNYANMPKTLKNKNTKPFSLWGKEAANYLQIFIYHRGLGRNSSEEQSLSLLVR
jgi:hypothetical protein